jgi:hypothetical protein
MSSGTAVPEPPVPGYAGHADAAARRLSDQQVRASVGELLTGLRARVAPGGIRDRIDALLLRCEFGDQHVVRALEEEDFAQPELAALVESYDHKLVAAAKAAVTARLEDVPVLLDTLEHVFDERAAAIGERLKG